MIIMMLLVIFFSSCKKKNSLVDNIYGNPHALSFTAIEVNLDDESLNSYPLHSSFVYNDDDYLLAYNYITRAFDVFNISSKSISRHIILMPEGPNGVLNPTGVYAHSIDSIWVCTDDNVISLIDSNGIVKERISIDVSEETPNLLINFTTCTSKLYYNSSRRSLFYLTFTVKNDKSNFCVHEYFLSDGSVKKYPIKSIGNHDFRNKYGWKQFPNVTYNERSILYNFPIESNIYLIDIESEKMSVFGGKSSNTSNEVSQLTLPYDFSDADRHLCENVHFFELLYEPKKEVYYRLHFDRIDYDASADVYSLLFSKQMYLTVFNDKMEVINETKLDRNKYGIYNCWGVLSQGFFIAKDNLHFKDIDYEKLQIDVFSIE